MSSENIELATEMKEKGQEQKKMVFVHPQAEHVSIQKLADESVEVIIGLAHKFIFSKSDLLLVENLRENLCMDLRK